MKRFTMRRLLASICMAGLLGASSCALAAAFQLWEQDGASIGNYHAGYAAWANDASTAFYNPAGIPRFKNQQVVVSTDAVLSDLKFKGTVTNPALIIPDQPMSTTAQGGTFSLIPALSYVAPLSDWMGFGFNVNVPFGLKVNYGKNNPIAYATSLASITVVDVSPSLGFQINKQASVGIGFDIQRAFAEFDDVAAFINAPVTNSTSTNQLNDTGYGYHLGGLYEFNAKTRVGLSYHSQVVHHLSGTSKFSGPLATIYNGQTVLSDRAMANITLPPYTALSGYYRYHPQLALMASVIYTQWSTFQSLKLNNAAGLMVTSGGIVPTNNIQLVMPQNFCNSWNLSVGTDYYVSDDMTLRGGVGYDQTPVKNAFRTIILPDNNRYVVALGGHYKATKTVGVDVGWNHLFFAQSSLNPPPTITNVVTNGNVNGSADVISGQLTWDIY